MGRDGNGEHNDRFHSIHQYETDDLTGAVHNPGSCRERPPMEVCFVYSDVDAAYKVIMHVVSLIDLLVHFNITCVGCVDGLIMGLNESVCGGEWSCGGERA